MAMVDGGSPRRWKRLLRWSVLPVTAIGVAVSSGPAVADPGSDAAVTPAITSIPWTQGTARAPTGTFSSAFTAVSCVTANACEAVGWKQASTSQNPASALAGVWNGKAWKLQKLPKPSGATQSWLYGLSCTAANACEAVGSYNNAAGYALPLAMAWNGTTWTTQKPPSLSSTSFESLVSVSCIASGPCEAVGQAGTQTLSEGWNGTTWSVQTAPTTSSAQLNGVSCSSSSACEAVGETFPTGSAHGVLAERWNGTKWSVQTIPRPSTTANSLLSSVSCLKTGSCEATGSVAGTPGAPVAEKWSGTAWSLQSMPGPSSSQAIAVFFGQVSCSGPKACDAIGLYTTSGPNVVLVEAWDGTAWTTETAPSPADVQIRGISCPATGACQAVGDYYSGSSAVSVPLVMSGR
jgi:hypothetical protein